MTAQGDSTIYGHPQITERTKLISHPSSASYLTYFPSPPRPPPRTPSQRLLRQIKINKPREKVSSWIGDAGFDFRFEKKKQGVSWRIWGKEEISGDALVLPLLIVTFSCALADSITLQRYSTFATSMTGNTVLLAIRVMGSTEKPPLLAGVSLLGFVVSGLIFGQVGAIIGHSRRDWLLFNFLAQIGILFTNVILVSRLASPIFRPEGSYGWVYLLLLAIQGGIQVTQAANSGARELPTAMMTTPYAALISDPSLFSSGRTVDVRSRNRRVIYIITFWLGAFFGAGLSTWCGMGWATGAVLGCKVVVVVYIGLLRGKGKEGQGEQGVREPNGREVIAVGAEGYEDDDGVGDSEEDIEEAVVQSRRGDIVQRGVPWNRTLDANVAQGGIIDSNPSPRRPSPMKDRRKVLSASRERRTSSDMSPPTLDRRPEEGRRESRDERDVAM